MKIDLRVIQQHCQGVDCSQCSLGSRGGCEFRYPPEMWRVEVMELAISQIGVSKAREAIDRWGLE